MPFVQVINFKIYDQNKFNEHVKLSMNKVARTSGFAVYDQGRLIPPCSDTETSKNIGMLHGAFIAINCSDSWQTAREHRLVCAFVVRIQPIGLLKRGSN